MQKTSGQCHINKTLWLFLLSLLFFPENYQPATSRSPRESWTADGSTNAKTAKHLAVLSLFLAVSDRKDKNREGDTTAANRSSASSDEIRIIPMSITTVDICQFIKDLFRTIGITVAGRHCGRVLNYPYEALRAALSSHERKLLQPAHRASRNVVIGGNNLGEETCEGRF